MQLGQILVRKQLISLFQLKQTLTLQSSYSQKLGELMVMQGLIEHKDLKLAIKDQYWRQNGFGVFD